MDNLLLPVVGLALGFILGVFMGIYDTKRVYGIPHRVPPEDCEVVIHGRYDHGC